MAKTVENSIPHPNRLDCLVNTILRVYPWFLKKSWTSKGVQDRMPERAGDILRDEEIPLVGGQIATLPRRWSRGEVVEDVG